MITWEREKKGIFVEISNLEMGDTFELNNCIGMVIEMDSEIRYISLEDGSEWYISETTEVKPINLKIIVE